MIFYYVAPTATGVLLNKLGWFPCVNLPDDASIEQLQDAVDSHYGASLQLLIPVGTLTRDGISGRVIAVGEVYEQGLLRSLPPPSNLIGLLASLVRGALSNWRVEVITDDDFSIKFLGS